MKPASLLLRRLLHPTCALAGWLCATPLTQAGLTVDIHWYHTEWGYYFFPILSTNTLAPENPLGDYLVASPQYPTNGSRLLYQITTNGFGYGIQGDYGAGSYYDTFDSLLYGVTNGLWSIWVTNSTSTKQYAFKVTVSGVTSNMFGAPVSPVFPINGAQFVTNQPLFTWTGPVNWAGTLTASDLSCDTNGACRTEVSADLPPSQTFWACPVRLPDGTNELSVDYHSNVTALIVASQPTNSAGEPIAGWLSTATLQVSFVNAVVFTVGREPVNPHQLIAHYAFDDTADLGIDSSGAGNDLGGGSWWGPNHQVSADAVAGAQAVLFFGASSLTPSVSTRASWDRMLAGSFTISGWVKTTASRGNDTDEAISGASIFWAYSDSGGTNDTLPLAITGSKAAFSTRDQHGATTTLHSVSSVNDGIYHLITVTRDSATGEKKIYIDGQFEASEIGTVDPLDGNDYYLSIGGTTMSSYTGLLDDVQLYSGVLEATDIARLFTQPGTTAPNVSATDFNPALNTWGLPWSTSGATAWLVETTNTTDTISSAQSGSVTNEQTSALSVTVTGPGYASFYWSSIANDPNGGFSCEFDIDGDPRDGIMGDTAWSLDGPFPVPGGSHVLTWTAYANGDTDPTQAAFLDQFSFTPLQPVELRHPLNNGTHFEFQFASQFGFTHTVEYRTNLVDGSGWQPCTNLLGDDSLKTLAIPLSVFGPSAQAYLRISTW